MFGLEFLDVAIGIIFVYLLLSLICSAFGEIIEAWFKNRAMDLERGIRELLHDPSGTTLAHEFYNHPLIHSLFGSSYNPGRKRNWLGRTELPSYIPARNFALALMDIVSQAGATNPSGAAGSTTYPNAPANPAPAPGGALQPLRDMVRTIGNPQVEQALMTLLDAAGDDVNKARENIESWYDTAMDRVSGGYKRRVQIILLFLGLFLAVVLNADSIAIIRGLSLDPGLRSAVVASAQQYMSNNPPPTSTAPSGSSAAPAPTPRQRADSPSSTSSTRTACDEDPNSPACRIEKNLEAVRKLGLPIGWDRNIPGTYPGDIRDPQNVIPWLIKALGWLLTAFAVSLGAPFWFDLLNKFTVIRSTVKPHEKSPEEQSED